MAYGWNRMHKTCPKLVTGQPRFQEAGQTLLVGGATQSQQRVRLEGVVGNGAI